MAPWMHIRASNGSCSPPAFLATFPAVPHQNPAVCSQPWLPQCRGCTGLLLQATVLNGHCEPHAEEPRHLVAWLQPTSPSHGTLGAGGTPGCSCPSPAGLPCHPSLPKPPCATTQTISFGAPDQTGFQCGTPETTDDGGENTLGGFQTEVPGNESGPTTRGEGYERHAPQLPVLLWCQLGVFFLCTLPPLSQTVPPASPHRSV